MKPTIIKTRLDLFRSLPEGVIGAEVGVWRGGFSAEILQRCPQIAHLYMVDSWCKIGGKYAVDSIDSQDHEANKRKAEQATHIWADRRTLVHAFSADAARTWFDRGFPALDFVYIDAAHYFEAAYEDLNLWEKVLSPIGIIMGHDYTRIPEAVAINCQVIEAVDRFCAERGYRISHLTAEPWTSYRLEKL